MKPEELKSVVKEGVLEALSEFLTAQLRAIHRFRNPENHEKPLHNRVGMSQVKLVEDILKSEPNGLHINDIISKVEKVHGIRLERESIVSALTKKVKQGNRFVRVSKNTFALTRNNHNVH